MNLVDKNGNWNKFQNTPAYNNKKRKKYSMDKTTKYPISKNNPIKPLYKADQKSSVPINQGNYNNINNSYQKFINNSSKKDEIEQKKNGMAFLEFKNITEKKGTLYFIRNKNIYKNHNYHEINETTKKNDDNPFGETSNEYLINKKSKINNNQLITIKRHSLGTDEDIAKKKIIEQRKGKYKNRTNDLPFQVNFLNSGNQLKNGNDKNEMPKINMGKISSSSNCPKDNSKKIKLKSDIKPFNSVEKNLIKIQNLVKQSDLNNYPQNNNFLKTYYLKDKINDGANLNRNEISKPKQLIDKKFYNLKVNNFDIFFGREEKNVGLDINKFSFNIKKKKQKFDLNINKFNLQIDKIKKVSIKSFEKLKQKKIENFIVEGKIIEDKNYKDEEQTVLSYIEQHDFSEEELNLFIEALNTKIISKKKLKMGNKADKKATIPIRNEEEFKLEEEIYEKYGFINDGNNCYLNSSLQLLTRVKELKLNILRYHENDICTNTITEGKLTKEFKKIFIDLKNRKEFINPKDLKRVMGKIDERYKDNNQEDANEFISNFLDGLLDETGDKSSFPEPLKMNNQQDQIAYNKFYDRFYKKRGNSFLLDLFYSIIKTQKVCKSCGKVISIKFNAYNIIELPIYNLAENNKDDLKFRDILADFMKKNENIIGECKYCKAKNNIYEIIKIYKLPKYLMFYFGRTIDDEYINNNIIYHKELNLDSFINNNEKFILECVIEHSGGAHYGHYTSICSMQKGEKWYKFSDTSYYESKTKYHGNNAIILLYNKIN